MRICLRGECKLTGENNHICCLQCEKQNECNAIAKCTEDTTDTGFFDWNTCSKEVNS